MPSGRLISFFRNSDHTSAIVGQRQTSTFQALAILSGKLESGVARSAPVKAAQLKTIKKASPKTKQKQESNVKADPTPPASSAPAATFNGNGADVGLTVRIEINLPAAGDQETYDRIFKSIRENLLNAKVS